MLLIIGAIIFAIIFATYWCFYVEPEGSTGPK
jgi:hypothetical protein